MLGWAAGIAVVIVAAAPIVASASPDWAVVVRPFGAKTRETATSFWVGLRNVSPADRAFCMLGVSYRFELRNGNVVDQPSVEHPVAGSPHQCADSMGTLVLAGETHFVRVTPRLPPDVLRPKGLRFRIQSEEACLTPNCGRHAFILLEEPDASAK